MDVRLAEPGEILRLGRIWYDGWQDAHAGILPEGLRTIQLALPDGSIFPLDVWRFEKELYPSR